MDISKNPSSIFIVANPSNQDDAITCKNLKNAINYCVKEFVSACDQGNQGKATTFFFTSTVAIEIHNKLCPNKYIEIGEPRFPPCPPPLYTK